MLCAMTQSTKNAEIQEKFIFYVVTKTERMVAWWFMRRWYTNDILYNENPPFKSFLVELNLQKKKLFINFS